MFKKFFNKENIKKNNNEINEKNGFLTVRGV